MEGPEVHAPHAAHTGHRWLDITLGVSALLVSAVSLYVAVHHGETMEKLVEANSFPNVEFGADLAEGSAPARFAVRIVAENNGVGPARIQTVELWDDRRPISTVGEIIGAIKGRGDGRTLSARVGGTSVVGALIGAGKTKDVFSLEMDRAAWYPAAARFSATFQNRVCYCSVFDECFVTDSRLDRGRPRHVKICPVPAKPYQDDLAGLISSEVAKPAQ